MDLALLATIIGDSLALPRFSGPERRELRDYVMRELARQGHDTTPIYFDTLDQLAAYCRDHARTRTRAA